uniref:Secreted protein n=1 Tax=Strix occidentalis caurina TaxID=311401 RepID=A0A8D0FCX8_STROC
FVPLCCISWQFFCSLVNSEAVQGVDLDVPDFKQGLSLVNALTARCRPCGYGCICVCVCMSFQQFICSVFFVSFGYKLYHMAPNQCFLEMDTLPEKTCPSRLTFSIGNHP